MSSRPVVVAVKEDQPAALEFAVTAAKSRNVGLRVVHCVEPVTAWDSPSVDDILWLGAGQEVLDRANEEIGRIAPNLPAEFVLEPGAPDVVLLKEAENAAMLVLGTDSQILIERLLDGHVAEHLAKRSPVPVGIVPERSIPQTPTGAVFVAIDATTLAAGPLRFAFEEASRRNNELYVVHVAPADVMFDETTALRAEIAEILAGWSERYPDVRVTRQLLFDEADEGCRRAGEESEVLVVGRHSKSLIALLLGHPVLKQIVRKALSPCVVVPDDWGGEG